MCYSPEVSIGTFLFVSGISAYIWNRNKGDDRAASLLFFVIVFMQLIEFFLWTNQTCGPVNRTFSSIVPILLYIQPLLFSLIIWKFRAGFGSYTPYIFYGWLFALIPSLFYMNSIGLFQNCIRKGQNGHLRWDVSSLIDFSNNRVFPIAYYGSLLYLFATLKDRFLSFLLLLVGFISMALTSNILDSSWGSVWCHSVNASAFLYLFL
jgi:hypothetical protein